MPRLSDKVAIVTGAGGDIGAAICRRFAQEGAKVVCADIDAERAEATAASLDGTGLAIGCDIGDPVSAAAATARVLEAFGALHVLVNNAAAWIADGTIETTSLEDWERGLRINLTGAMLMSKYAIPAMRKQGGSIVHVASQLGHVGRAGKSWYCVAKAGLVQLAHTMAIDHAIDGIRVNSLSPGPTATRRNRTREGSEAETAAYYSTLMAVGRLGRTEEIANAALFLASDESSYVTGTDLLVDGGYNALVHEPNRLAITRRAGGRERA